MIASNFLPVCELRIIWWNVVTAKFVLYANKFFRGFYESLSFFHLFFDFGLQSTILKVWALDRAYNRIGEDCFERYGF